jgi:hypothetical protein
VIAGLIFGNDVGGSSISSYSPVFTGTATFYSVVSTGTVTITNTASSTSTTTGALLVSGGAGFGGNIYAANIYTNNTQILPTFLIQITATTGQTTFTVTNGYSVGYIQVYANGVLLSSSDYTASNGSTVVLNQARNSGDVIQIMAGVGFAVSQNGLATGGTINGTLNVVGTLQENGYRAITTNGGTINSNLNVVGTLTQNGITVVTTSGGTIQGTLNVTTLNVTDTLTQNGTKVNAFATAMAVALGI